MCIYDISIVLFYYTETKHVKEKKRNKKKHTNNESFYSALPLSLSSNSTISLNVLVEYNVSTKKTYIYYQFNERMSL